MPKYTKDYIRTITCDTLARLAGTDTGLSGSTELSTLVLDEIDEVELGLDLEDTLKKVVPESPSLLSFKTVDDLVDYLYSLPR